MGLHCLAEGCRNNARLDWAGATAGDCRIGWLDDALIRAVLATRGVPRWVLPKARARSFERSGKKKARH